MVFLLVLGAAAALAMVAFAVVLVVAFILEEAS
jgi:hypothetical protein